MLRRELTSDEPSQAQKTLMNFLKEESKQCVDEGFALPEFKKKKTISLRYMQPQVVLHSNSRQVCLMAYTLAPRGLDVTIDSKMRKKITGLARDPDFRVRQTIAYSKNLETEQGSKDRVYFQFLRVEWGNDPQKVAEAMFVQKGYHPGDVTKLNLRKTPRYSPSTQP